MVKMAGFKKTCWLGGGVAGALLLGLAPVLCAAEPGKTASGSKADDNPYAVIGERNIFHLNPIPPPPEPEKPKPDLPDVKITGIIKIGDQTKAMFMCQPKDKKKEPAYFSLAEGEKGSKNSDELELVKIHPSEDGVDVIINGTAVTLSMEKDTLQPTAAIAPGPGGGREGRPPEPGGLPGRPIFRPPGMPGGPGNGFSFPTRRRMMPQ